MLKPPNLEKNLNVDNTEAARTSCQQRQPVDASDGTRR